MKNKCLWGLVAGVLSGIVPHAAAQVVSSVAMPVIQLTGTNEVELGKITCEELKLITFVFRNPGSVPVEIKQITSTCPCIRGYPEQAVIPPNGELPITAELNPLKVKSVFKRGLWIHTTDPRQVRIPLIVSGEVVPFFEGFPQEPVQFRRGAPGEAWTNVFPLTATLTNLSLGTPVITKSKDMRVTASVAANQAQAGSFDLTLVAVPLVAGRSSATVEIPIAGRPDLPNLDLLLYARVGTELYVTPSKFLMLPSDQPLTRGYLIRTGETEADPKQVAFSPEREGVTYDVSPSKRKKAHLSLRVTVTPDALARLMREKEPKLRISYPNYKEAEITFIPHMPPGPEQK